MMQEVLFTEKLFYLLNSEKKKKEKKTKQTYIFKSVILASKPMKRQAHSLWQYLWCSGTLMPIEGSTVRPATILKQTKPQLHFRGFANLSCVTLHAVSGVSYVSVCVKKCMQVEKRKREPWLWSVVFYSLLICLFNFSFQTPTLAPLPPKPS